MITPPSSNVEGGFLLPEMLMGNFYSILGVGPITGVTFLSGIAFDNTELLTHPSQKIIVYGLLFFIIILWINVNSSLKIKASFPTKLIKQKVNSCCKDYDSFNTYKDLLNELISVYNANSLALKKVAWSKLLILVSSTIYFIILILLINFPGLRIEF